MNWLILVLIAVFSGSSHIYIDNYISDFYFKGRGAVAQKMFFTVTLVLLAIILAAIAGPVFFSFEPVTYLLLFSAGLLASLSGIPYYRALELDDSTNLGIFIQIAPILYLIFGWLLLGDSISPLQLVAFAIIMVAPFLIIATTGKRSRKVKLRAVFYAFLYVLLGVLGNLTFIKESSSCNVDFLSGMALVMLGKGIGNLIILAIRPKWRKRFKDVCKSSKRKVLRPLFGTFFFIVVKDFAYRAALISAPSAALASAASDSAEPIMIFFMGIVLTLIWPKFGREKLTRKSVLVHLAATILVVIGIVLLQF